MPVYEYHCNSCHRDFEYQQRMSDPEKETCEACSGKLERVISRTAFALKGGGWYKDLYASSRPEGGKSGGESPKAESSGSDSATPAAAPAAAAPAAPTTTSSGSSGTSGSGSSSS